KQAVSLALMEAARAGSTQQANPAAIEKAFTQALLPLFPATQQLSAAERLAQAMAERTRQAKLPAWQIRVIQPNQAVFDDFAQTTTTPYYDSSLVFIENAYQAEQDQSYRQNGWLNGLGPRSGLDIYQANTLVLRVSYYHRPLVPGISALLKTLAPTPNNHKQA